MILRTPSDVFAKTLKTNSIAVLPLVRNTAARHPAGWCTYSDGFDRNPEIEIFCGGDNEKSVAAAACWRQGRLLHFGFEIAPSAMNVAGSNLLLNCIAYISRFADDAPIAVTPSVFAGPVALPRTYLDRRFQPGGDLKETGWMVTEATFQKISSMKAEEAQRWFAGNRAYFHPSPGPEPKLEIDSDAQAMGVPIDQPQFFRKLIAALDGPDSARAKTLLVRYGPEEIHPMNRAALARWFEENSPYLFFSDQGDYKWYIDPLAKKRRVPSAELRGPLRASPN